MNALQLIGTITFPFGMWAFIYIGATLATFGVYWFTSMMVSAAGMGFTLIVCVTMMSVKDSKKKWLGDEYE